ncbi:MAG TPA: glycosyltransferase family 4 protein [Phycisphaerae bacterium]|nr:glycosyltransferase family 4 protein [Phycisphaerae bacterium]
MPNLLMIHEVIGPHNAIGKVAESDLRIALNAGYNVTVISKIFDSDTKSCVKWHPLYVPPRLFYWQWTTARRYIKQALARARAESKFDIIHAHQPQVADLADVFQCHFLTRVAAERHCLEERKDLRSRFLRLQQQGVLHAEDKCFRNWNPNTWMLYDSALTQEEFHRLYGKCPLEQVLVYDFPPLRIATPEDRAAARKKFLPNVALASRQCSDAPIVVGYLGGMQERKGYKRLLAALKDAPDIHLLFAGSHTENFSPPPELTGRITPLGLVSDTPNFYAACDVLLVPSLFEPLGLVAFESAARGTPVIATPEVGALPHLLEFNAGEKWNPTESVPPLIRQVAANRAAYQPGIQRMAEALSFTNYGKNLLAIYNKVLARTAGVSPAVRRAHAQTTITSQGA